MDTILGSSSISSGLDFKLCLLGAEQHQGSADVAPPPRKCWQCAPQTLCVFLLPVEGACWPCVRQDPAVEGAALALRGVPICRGVALRQPCVCAGILGCGAGTVLALCACRGSCREGAVLALRVCQGSCRGCAALALCAKPGSCRRRRCAGPACCQGSLGDFRPLGGLSTLSTDQHSPAEGVGARPWQVS